MDRFARNYLIALLSVMFIAAGWYWLSQDSRVSQINARLEADSELADFPFTFKVMTLENGVAIMNSPRSAEVPAMQFLRTAYPALRATAVDHPDMMAAQDRLASVQSRAAKLVESQEGVQAVRWVIDERWFNEHGVFLNLAD
ncbi:MAG: hypothetical protein NWP69_04655 [Congregibacter sp.]|nr:hypothetical protein [Congregibacter sp.]